MFTLGIPYTREQIHSQVGGSLQSYLPHVGGRVVAACLRLDTNPDAPRVILAGTGDGIEHAAELLIAQHTPVPSFLKRGAGNWEYVGDFEVQRWSQDAAELAQQRLRSGRDNLTRVIHMIPSRAMLQPLPEEVQQTSTYTEGSVQRILVNRYERDPKARAACIEHYGPTCATCGFRFGAVYGSLADGYIHVHHLTPLAEIGEQYEVDPINDLRPVCANCHAVIHMGGECRSVEHAKSLIDSRVLAFWASFA